MKRESLLDRYRDAKETGINNGYGIGQDNAPEFALDQKERFVEECLATETEHFRQFSPFEFTAMEFNRPVRYFDRDDNVVKEEVMEWVNDKIWEKYENGVYIGVLQAWGEWKKLH